MRLGVTIFLSVLAALLVFSALGFLTAPVVPRMMQNPEPEIVQPVRNVEPIMPPPVEGRE